MKIHTPTERLTADKATTSTTARSGKDAGTAAAPQGDSISLSPLSAQLQALEATLSTGSEFDRTKVEAIKQAIREGKLAVNADVIADRMLAHAMAVVGQGK